MKKLATAAFNATGVNITITEAALITQGFLSTGGDMIDIYCSESVNATTAKLVTMLVDQTVLNKIPKSSNNWIQLLINDGKEELSANR